MKSLLNLFDDVTWTIFRDRGAAITGFEAKQRRLAKEKVSGLPTRIVSIMCPC